MEEISIKKMHFSQNKVLRAKHYECTIILAANGTIL